MREYTPKRKLGTRRVTILKLVLIACSGRQMLHRKGALGPGRLRVKRVGLTACPRLPLYPDEQTSLPSDRMSQRCQRTKSLRDSPLKRGPTRGGR
jgi:hypothetical protein